MIYVILGLLILIIILLFVKIELKIEKNNRIDTTLIISKIFKYKIDLDEMVKSNSSNIKDTINGIKKITNPFIRKVFSEATVERINIKLLFKIDDNPYIIFMGHMLLLKLRNLCYDSFKKIKKEYFKVSFGKPNFEGVILVSISLGKLVTIIIGNYKQFKLLIKKGAA